jgi:hypothetical protein
MRRRIILTWKWRKLFQLQKNKRSTIQHCDNSRNLNAFRWRRLCQTKWWIRRQCLLFIELIQPRVENEDETVSENDHEDEDENENDKNESKQYQIRPSRNTKTDDAKCEDVVNRLHFMKLKKLKNISFEKRSFFFSRCELNEQCCLSWFD